MSSPSINFKEPLKVIPEAELEKTQSIPHHTSGFGDIWKFIWSTSSSDPPITVAIKVVRVPDFTQTALLAKTAWDIRREAHVWGNLEHDHILSLHGITTDFGVLPAFVSPWMAKGSLDSYLNQKPYPIFKIFQKLDMSRQIASGLKYLHDKGIVHGDLTPTNILINSDDKLCLADFGLSMILAESGNPTFNSYHEGNVRWMAPEMVAPPDSEQVEPIQPTKPTMSADVYSHGCIALQLLCGQKPYSPLVQAFHVIGAILGGRAPFRQLTGVDEGNKQYWLKCVSTDVNARPKIQEILAFIAAELRNLQY